MSVCFAALRSLSLASYHQFRLCCQDSTCQLQSRTCSVGHVLDNVTDHHRLGIVVCSLQSSPSLVHKPALHLIEYSSIQFVAAPTHPRRYQDHVSKLGYFHRHMLELKNPSRIWLLTGCACKIRWWFTMRIAIKWADSYLSCAADV